MRGNGQQTVRISGRIQLWAVIALAGLIAIYMAWSGQAHAADPVEGDVQVSAGVSDYLSFTVLAPISPPGITVDAGSIDFGVQKGEPVTAIQDLLVSTNNPNGYSVSVRQSDRLKSGLNEIPDTPGDAGIASETAADDWLLGDTYGFGYALANTIGTDAAFSLGYRQFPSEADMENAEPVMGNAGPAYAIVAIGYKLNVDPTQVAGAYSNTITLLATTNF